MRNDSETPEKGSRRKRCDDILVVTLASGLSIKKASAKARMGEATVARRLADPAFVKRLDEARAAMLDRAIGRMSATLTDAATTLRQLLRSQRDSVKLGAARAILEMHCRLRESVVLAERVAELEALLKGGAHGEH
jgi:hypothetical protein